MRPPRPCSGLPVGRHGAGQRESLTAIGGPSAALRISPPSSRSATRTPVVRRCGGAQKVPSSHGERPASHRCHMTIRPAVEPGLVPGTACSIPAAARCARPDRRVDVLSIGSLVHTTTVRQPPSQLAALLSGWHQAPRPRDPRSRNSAPRGIPSIPRGLQRDRGAV